MTVWLVVLAIGLGSYVIRVVPMVLGGQLRPTVERACGRAGAAALAALVVGDVMSAGPAGPTAAMAAAVGVGLTVALAGRSMPWVLASGVLAHAVAAIVLA